MDIWQEYVFPNWRKSNLYVTRAHLLKAHVRFHMGDCLAQAQHLLCGQLSDQLSDQLCDQLYDQEDGSLGWGIKKDC